MKQIIGVVILSIFFFSCSFNIGQKKLNDFYKLSLDTTMNIFVMKRDSSKVQSNKIKLKYPLLKKAKFILDNDQEFNANEFIAYQDGNCFYTYTPSCKWTTKRFIKGRISKYFGSYEQMSTRGQFSDPKTGVRQSTMQTFYESYLQKDNGPLVSYQDDYLLDMVKDYAPSLEIMNTYLKNRKKVALPEKAISVYNNREGQ